MSKYRTLLFDLDGTLTDTRPGIMRCLENTFATLGAPLPSDLDRFLGPPLPESFVRFCGMNEQQTERAVGIFRERYSNGELFNAKLFDGIPELLCKLTDYGFTLAVCTCKVEKYAKSVLEHFGIAKYFAIIGGSNETRTQKSEVIEYVLNSLDISDKSGVLMIGDRDNDIIGAEKCGLRCLYALWGYGSEAEAKKYNALAAVRSPKECLGFILSSQGAL